ncbi:homoserine dehydrogenase [Desertibacillus haloalkaliphilus]|uniref:homoserine dehydrogenase n=1 Tax=Desertibacillus haloalkaliphilus TaxID=1328930 RepID=UPI001C27CDE4|nr:homoserine dehydrogenase [Desertibacillus haloalkaliphilus]MBU8905518.1 homoserine dehydrogenase [Desertibacillus haloalkaliphilus]
MISIGLLGFGTVGEGVFERIYSAKAEIEQVLGDRVEVKKILVKDFQKQRNADEQLFTDNPNDFFKDRYDIVFEQMGGVEPAKDYISRLLNRNVPVITANKKLIAFAGRELEALANEHGSFISYEAAVAGGIPIINVLSSLLPTTAITKVSGILNGTTNYIVTEMNEKGRDFDEVLEEAQALGFAEADPTDDVEGFDAWYKLRILSKLCFGSWAEQSTFARIGIRNVERWHIEAAKTHGLKMKLVAEARTDGERVFGGVRPSFVAQSHPLATVDGVTNAVHLEGESGTNLLFTGPGAGKEPTANSMVEDFVHHFRQTKQPEYKRKNIKACTNQSEWLLFFKKEDVDRVKEHLDQITYHLNEVIEEDEGFGWFITTDTCVEYLPLTDVYDSYPIYGRKLVKLEAAV